MSASAGVLSWLLVAAAAALLPAPRRRPPVLGVDGGAARVLAAAAATALACVAVAGPVAGGAAALVLAPAVWLVLRRLRSRPAGAPVDLALPLVLDLVAAGLRAGATLDDALVRAAPAASAATGDPLRRVAGLLRLGADPSQAWAAAGVAAVGAGPPGRAGARDLAARAGPLAPVAAVAVRSAASGIRLAGAFEQLAAEVRAEQRAAGARRAHRAGVFAMGPLAACFLPSFVCLGVIPVVVGIAGNVALVTP